MKREPAEGWQEHQKRDDPAEAAATTFIVISS
jgi:hypothetical protein